MSRLLIIAGGILILAGLLWPLLVKCGLGRLPGDVVLKQGDATLYIPIVSSLILSVLISVTLWFFARH